MPLYEYYCDTCDKVFEALRPVSASTEPAKCPGCGAGAGRIMPTQFASMSRRQGVKERVPFHHHGIRNVGEKRPIARVKAKADGPKPAANAKRTPKLGGKKKG
jgi:putative FmdB family regulatory protein